MKKTLLPLLIMLSSCSENNSDRSIHSNDSAELINAILELTDSVHGTFAVSFIDLQNFDNQLHINADEMFHAASTMKTPVMIEAYRQAESGGFSIHDPIPVHNEFRSIVDGSTFAVDKNRDSGKEMHEKIGTEVSIREIIYDMTINSGNLSTNLIVDRVGAQNVTQTMRLLGAEHIEILRGVEDMKAFDAGLSNRTTSRDMAIIFSHIANGTAASQASCEDMIAILLDQRFRSMIPAKLPEDVRVAHKTGSITGVSHDSGIVMLPDGRSYVLVILSKGLEKNEVGTATGATISRMIYDWFK